MAVVVVPAIAAAVAVTDIDVERYTTTVEVAGPVPSMAMVLVAGVVTGLAARAAAVIYGDWVALAGIFVAVSGVFLCVPETDALRLLPAPLFVAAIGCRMSVVRPLSIVLASGVIAAGVSWLAVVDGQARPTSIVGALGCFAALALVVVGRLAAGPAPIDRRRRRDLAVVVGAVIVLTSRVIGVRDDGAGWSAAAVAAVLGAAAVIVVRRLRPFDTPVGAGD